MFIRCRLPVIPARCVPDEQDPTYDRITPVVGPTDHSNLGLLNSTILPRKAGLNRAHVMEGVRGSGSAVMEGLDLSYMHALLVLGYEFSEMWNVDVRGKIGVTELGWCDDSK